VIPPTSIVDLSIALVADVTWDSHAGLSIYRTSVIDTGGIGYKS
jgi:hypothetical protein